MRRPRGDEPDDLGDVGGRQRRDPGVDGVRALLVTAEANQGELGFDCAGRDFGEPHRLAQQFTAQRAMQRTLRMLGRGVAAAAVVDLHRRDRRHGHDQAVARLDELGQQRAGDPQRADDVGLPHPAPVLQVRLGDGLEPPGPAGVVDQHIDPTQAGRQRLDRGAVCDVGHNSGAADFVGEPLNAVGATRHRDHVEALGGKGFRRCLADAGAGSGDHRHPGVGVRSCHHTNCR